MYLSCTNCINPQIDKLLFLWTGKNAVYSMLEIPIWCCRSNIFISRWWTCIPVCRLLREHYETKFHVGRSMALIWFCLTAPNSKAEEWHFSCPVNSVNFSNCALPDFLLGMIVRLKEYLKNRLDTKCRYNLQYAKIVKDFFLDAVFFVRKCNLLPEE